MLKYKVGNLIKAAQDGEVNVIAHCCNVFCTMGSGIAPQIKKAFPAAFDADCKTAKGDYSKMGTFSSAYVFGEPTLAVYNLYGQGGFWGRNKGLRDLDYNALYDSLDAMTKDLLSTENDFLFVGLPLLGCGLAQGNWKIVSTMIEETLVKAGFDVTIYVLNEKEIPLE